MRRTRHGAERQGLRPPPTGPPLTATRRFGSNVPVPDPVPFADSPNRLFAVTVARREQLSPAFVRLGLTGPGLDAFAPAGRDLRVKILLPGPEGHPASLVDGLTEAAWRAAWRALPVPERRVLRSYTAPRVDPAARWLDLDFYLHDPTGPASAWAASARVGDPCSSRARHRARATRTTACSGTPAPPPLSSSALTRRRSRPSPASSRPLLDAGPPARRYGAGAAAEDAGFYGWFATESARAWAEGRDGRSSRSGSGRSRCTPRATGWTGRAGRGTEAEPPTPSAGRGSRWPRHPGDSIFSPAGPPKRAVRVCRERAVRISFTCRSTRDILQVLIGRCRSMRDALGDVSVEGSSLGKAHNCGIMSRCWVVARLREYAEPGDAGSAAAEKAA